MYCSKCGSKIPDDSRFCNFCGTEIPKSTFKNTNEPVEENIFKAKNITDSEPITATVSWLSWKGRRNRSNYLFTELFLLLVRRIVGVVPNVIFTLGFMYLSFVNRMKRLQDMNCAGWWLIAYQCFLALYEAAIPFLIGVSLIYNIVTADGNIADMAVKKMLHDFATTLLTYYAPIIFDAIFALILAVKRGTVGPNKYGPDSVSE